MSLPSRMISVVVAALLLPACGSDDGADRRLTVYAASSLRDVLPALDDHARHSFEGSGTLQRQIERGAPADLFLAASPREPAALAAGGRCAAPVTFATNTLVLAVPRAAEEPVESLAELARGGRRISAGGPDVPVGAYTRALLDRLGLGDALTRNTVSEETRAAGVVAKVALGSADAGFVYVTDARAAADRVRVIALPRRGQPTVRYTGCVVRRDGADPGAASRYLRRLRSPEGREALRRFGFGVPAAAAGGAAGAGAPGPRAVVTGPAGTA